MAVLIGGTQYVRCVTKMRRRQHLAYLGAVMTLCGVRMSAGLKPSNALATRTCQRCRATAKA
jgi:hypothetical protein